jgi:hypothetical protein
VTSTTAVELKALAQGAVILEDSCRSVVPLKNPWQLLHLLNSDPVFRDLIGYEETRDLATA